MKRLEQKIIDFLRVLASEAESFPRVISRVNEAFPLEDPDAKAERDARVLNAYRYQRALARGAARQRAAQSAGGAPADAPTDAPTDAPIQGRTIELTHIDDVTQASPFVDPSLKDAPKGAHVAGAGVASGEEFIAAHAVADPPTPEVERAPSGLVTLMARVPTQTKPVADMMLELSERLRYMLPSSREDAVVVAIIPPRGEPGMDWHYTLRERLPLVEAAALGRDPTSPTCEAPTGDVGASADMRAVVDGLRAVVDGMRALADQVAAGSASVTDLLATKDMLAETQKAYISHLERMVGAA